MGKLAYMIVCLMIISVSILLLVDGYVDCSDVGGDYVRGLFWMECLSK